MRLRHYFKPKNAKDRDDRGRDEIHKELAELARGCAREGFVTLVCMHTPPCYHQCICCGSSSKLCPVRIPVGGKQACVLFCGTCQKRLSDDKMLSQMIYEVRRGIKNADPRMDMGLLLPHGTHIRIVWGHNLGSEVIS